MIGDACFPLYDDQGRVVQIGILICWKCQKLGFGGFLDIRRLEYDELMFDDDEYDLNSAQLGFQSPSSEKKIRLRTLSISN